MNTQGKFWPVRLLGTALLVIGLTADARGFDGKERDELILLVQKQETRFADFSAEVSTFQWDYKHQLVSSEFRRVLQWHDRLYDCVCRNTPNSNSEPTRFEFIWCDGSKLMKYVPPGKVEQFLNKSPSPVKFQPYEILLKTLGFDGSLSEFLQRDGQGLDAWRLQLGELTAEEPAEFRTLGIRADRRLPGSDYSSTIELRLAIDHGYLPCWGLYRENGADESPNRTEARVTEFAVIKDCGSLMKGIQVKASAGQDQTEFTSLIQFAGNHLTESPAEQVFQPLDFVGNPKISTYRDGQLQSVRTYRPIPVKKPEPWPPLTTWLVFNDVVFGILGLIYIVRLGIKFATRGRQKVSVT